MQFKVLKWSSTETNIQNTWHYQERVTRNTRGNTYQQLTQTIANRGLIYTQDETGNGRQLNQVDTNENTAWWEMESMTRTTGRSTKHRTALSCLTVVQATGRDIAPPLRVNSRSPTLSKSRRAVVQRRTQGEGRRARTVERHRRQRRNRGWRPRMSPLNRGSRPDQYQRWSWQN